VSVLQQQILNLIGSHNMALSEVDVLKPKDPSIVNWDDWPTYTLRKTSIISQLTGESVSLLKAHKDHAVKITGYLDTIASDQAHQSKMASI
jgi:hypothetical protein